ncbi:phage tail domain-containing protein [Melissococcus plutonius]|uniref:phage tail domain-containing protein n=1 Tax=Melissococcus plutonius TaxID=33970 RepID=UPI003EE4AA23
MITLYIKPSGEMEQDISKIKGLWFMGMDLVSPQYQLDTQAIGGQDGEVINSATRYGATTHKADFYLDTSDQYDLILAQQQLFKLLYGSRERIRIRNSLEPGKIMYCIPKPTTFTSIHYTQKTFSIDFLNPKGWRESIFCCDDKNLLEQYNGLTMGFPLDKDVNYQFTSNHFSVFNASDTEIDPLKQRHDFQLIFKGSGSPKIENKTTNTHVTYKGKLANNDQLIIDGVQVLKNGNNVGRDTDFGNIVLAKGWNEFVISNCTVSQVRFHFPFLYF